MTEGDPETAVSASLHETNRLKTNINTVVVFLFLFVCFFGFFSSFFVVFFIKSQTTDSFVNHFDGHFAYLKTLNFSFKLASNCVMN